MFGDANLCEAVDRGAVWVLKDWEIGHLELILAYNCKALHFLIGSIAHFFCDVVGFVDLSPVATEIV